MHQTVQMGETDENEWPNMTISWGIGHHISSLPSTCNIEENLGPWHYWLAHRYYSASVGEEMASRYRVEARLTVKVLQDLPPQSPASFCMCFMQCQLLALLYSWGFKFSSCLFIECAWQAAIGRGVFSSVYHCKGLKEKWLSMALTRVVDDVAMLSCYPTRWRIAKTMPSSWSEPMPWCDALQTRRLTGKWQCHTFFSDRILTTPPDWIRIANSALVHLTTAFVSKTQPSVAEIQDIWVITIWNSLFQRSILTHPPP